MSLTQSAISHALGRLRAIFDDELFLRRPSGFEPMGRAVELEPALRRLVEAAEQAVNPSAEDQPEDMRGMLRIGGSDYSCAVFAAPLVQRVSELAPHLMLAIRPLARRRRSMPWCMANLISVSDSFGARRPALPPRPGIRKATPCWPEPATQPSGTARFHWMPTPMRDTSWCRTRAIRRAWSMKPCRSRGGGVASWLPCRSFLSGLSVLPTSDLLLTAPKRLAQAHARRMGLMVFDPPVILRTFTVFLAWHEGAADANLLNWVKGQLRAVLRQ